MSTDLRIRNIEFNNFRNYSSFDSGEFSSFNIFVGKNGAGKTNIIEGIQLMTTLDSFRNPKWDEVIKWGENSADIRSSFFNDSRDLEMRLHIEEKKRHYFLNGKGKKNQDLLGLLPAVIFTPDDLQIVKGYAENRRNALDSIGTQLSNTYCDLKSRYQKALKQKNKYLASENLNDSLLSSFNESLAMLGSVFVKHRISLFSEFRKNFIETYDEMVSNQVIDVVYIPSWEEDDIEIRDSIYTRDQITEKLADKIESHRVAEIASKRCLVGPHRDEIKFYLDGFDARKFASQGQQRFISLSFKIAEMKTIKQINNQQPVLLLDDVLSELDNEKRDVLIEYLIDGTQTFITATDVENLDARILDRAKVFEVGRENGS